MKYLILIITGLMLISCNRKISDSLDQTQQLHGSWELISISGTDIQVSPGQDGITQPVLDIQVEEMKYTGNDGCNSFMGSITQVDGKRLVFGLAAGTRRMCMEMDLPDQFMRKLEQVNNYKIKNQTLMLYKEDGKELMRLKSTQ